MKNLKTILSTAALAAAMFTSCQSEEDVLIDENGNTNSANSETADLLVRNTAADGSDDDMLDGLSCASVIFPVVAEINGQEVTLVNESSLSLVAELFAEFTNDADTVRFQFPIQVQLSNYSQVTIANQQELDALKEACDNADETRDDAITCLDINFPVSMFTFDANAQQTGSVVLTSEKDTYAFINGLEDNQFFSVQYPITLTSENSGSITINSDAELATELQSCEASDDMDEEAAAEASTLKKELETILTDTSFKLESGVKAGSDFTTDFANYTFMFANDGQLEIRNRLTNFLENVEGEFDAQSQSSVYLILDFESNSEFSALNGTFEVVNQTSSKVELQSTTDSSFKLVFSKI